MASAGHMLCADVCLVKSKSGRLREYMSMRYGCLGLRCVIICSRQLVASAIGWMITAQQVRAAPPGDDVEWWRHVPRWRQDHVTCIPPCPSASYRLYVLTLSPRCHIGQYGVRTIVVCLRVNDFITFVVMLFVFYLWRCFFVITALINTSQRGSRFSSVYRTLTSVQIITMQVYSNGSPHVLARSSYTNRSR